MTDHPKTVTVEAFQVHTYHGQSYKVGATYECDEGDVETVEAQGKAKRVAKGEYKTTEVGHRRTTDLKAGTGKKKAMRAKAKK